ncbi:CPBP family intramembrane metalloprotease [Bacillus sp. PK3_68]|nr:CPBP family intramembrane metalloprotease [Bacillus sp. PK3_68]
MHHTFTKSMACLSLFVLLVISIQIHSYLLMSLCIFFAIFLFVILDKPLKSFVYTTSFFGIGFFIYLYINAHGIVQAESRELHIFLNRLSLVTVLIPLVVLSLFSSSPFIRYWRRPEWNEYIYFPFIWSGFHQTKIKFFLTIAVTVNILICTPFVILNGWSFIQEVWLLTIIFSLTNAVLEELIWRGALLSRFSEQLGEKWAVIITSLGFGLQHYSLGFPWLACLAFSVGGLFYGGLTIKSKSIVPSIVWHVILNVLMVLSGFILK